MLGLLISIYLYSHQFIQKLNFTSLESRKLCLDSYAWINTWSTSKSTLRVIHKPRGKFFGYFLPPPPSWSHLLNKAYVIKWFWLTPSPQLSTWFMDDPLPFVKFVFTIFSMFLGCSSRPMGLCQSKFSFRSSLNSRRRI